MSGVFYTARDNTYALTLTEAGATYPLVAVTKLAIKHDGIVYDTIANPPVLSFSTVTNIVTLNLGKTALPQGIYQMALILFDALRPGGVVWDSTLQFRIENI